jgi:sirohydrochlorin cobaltochelatase
MTITDTIKPAVLLIGHGTRIAAGVEEFWDLLSQLQQALPDRLCTAGFLELAQPTLGETLQNLLTQGAVRITALPAMLLAAGHVKQDIPRELNAFRTEHPDVVIHYGNALGINPSLLCLAQERIASCEAAFGPYYQRAETLLMVIGRGGSDREANAEISKLTRLLWESMGFGWAETGYMAVAKPLLADALERIHRLGFVNLLVFPFLLFKGRLTEEIHATAAAYQTHHPERRVVVAPYLNAHPLLVEAFIERLHEAEKGIETS